MTFKDDTVHRDLLAGLDEDDFSGRHVFGFHVLKHAAALDMCDIGTQVHQVRYALAAAAFGHLFEELSHLEEQHHEDSLRELSLCAGHKADSQRSHRRDTHKEVLAESLAVGETFGGLFQCIPADDQVRNQEQQQVLPGGPVGIFLYDYGYGQQHRRRDDLYKAAMAFFLLAVVVMMVLVFVLMIVLMIVLVMMLMLAILALVFVIFVYHISFLLFSECKGTRLFVQPGCKVSKFGNEGQ